MNKILKAKHGVYGANVPWWDERHFGLIERGGFTSVIVRTDTSPDVARRLYDAGYRVIVQTIEDFAGNCWANPYDCALKYFHRAAPFASYSNMLVIENEPNLFLGRHTRWFAEQFTRYIRAVWSIFKWLDPGSHWKLISPAMAVPLDRDPHIWYSIARDTLELFNYIGCHCYWQAAWQRDSNDWGRQYLMLHDLFPNKEIIITEYGNSNPAASWEKRASDYIAFLEKLPDYVESAHVFILGGAEDWNMFHLNEALCDKLCEALS